MVVNLEVSLENAVKSVTSTALAPSWQQFVFDAGEQPELVQVPFGAYRHTKDTTHAVRLRGVAAGSEDGVMRLAVSRSIRLNVQVGFHCNSEWRAVSGEFSDV